MNKNVFGVYEIDGIYRLYYYGSNILRRKVPYVNGLKHGTATTYDKHGNIEHIRNYINGDENGLYSWYFLSKLECTVFRIKHNKEGEEINYDTGNW